MKTNLLRLTSRRPTKSQAECLDSLHAQGQRLQDKAETYPMLPIVLWIFISTMLLIGLDTLLQK